MYYILQTSISELFHYKLKFLLLFTRGLMSRFPAIVFGMGVHLVWVWCIWDRAPKTMYNTYAYVCVCGVNVFPF
jgi:hypothetical protein